MGTKPGYFLHSAWELNLVIFCTPHGNQTWLFSSLCIGTFVSHLWLRMCLHLVIPGGPHRNPHQPHLTHRKKWKEDLDKWSWMDQEGWNQKETAGSVKNIQHKKSHKPHGRLYSELQASLSSTSLQTLLELVMPHSCPPMLSAPSERSGY